MQSKRNVAFIILSNKDFNSTRNDKDKKCDCSRYFHLSVNNQQKHDANETKTFRKGL